MDVPGPQYPAGSCECIWSVGPAGNAASSSLQAVRKWMRFLYTLDLKLRLGISNLPKVVTVVRSSLQITLPRRRRRLAANLLEPITLKGCARVGAELSGRRCCIGCLGPLQSDQL